MSEAVTREREAFLDGEVTAAGFGSLTGAITEDEWYDRVNLLFKMKARLA